MTARVRADLDELPAYVAGRSVAGAIKLASNEVSAGPLPGVREAVERAAAEVHRYPDMGVTELVEALSKRLDVPAEQLAVGCGSVALCQQLVQAMCTPEHEVVYPWRSFEAYPILSRVAGATGVPVPLTGGHAVDPEALLAAVTPATRVLFACTPNNPTGTVLHRAELADFLARVPPHVLVVLDEAYREFVTDPDAPDGVELVQRHRNVVSVRTFSKAYGLAGVRVGYAVAPVEVAAALRKVSIPFSVNALGQAAALASLEAREELRERCARVVAERERVHRELTAAGYEVPESQANFVWLPLGERSQAFAEHCLDGGVVVRAYAPDGVRVTVGDEHENDVFLQAARSFPG